MTHKESVNTVETLADSIIDGSDPILAAAEDAFRQATGLQDSDDTAEALGALFCAYGDIWQAVAVSAFWAGFYAAQNGKTAT